MHKQKFLALILTIALLLTLAPPAYAQDLTADAAPAATDENSYVATAWFDLILELIRQTPVGGAPVIEQVVVKAPAPVVGSGEQLAFSSINDEIAQSFIGTCPDCGSQLEFAEGCVKCHVCGFSECG